MRAHERTHARAIDRAPAGRAPVAQAGFVSGAPWERPGWTGLHGDETKAMVPAG
jgi:hypothetical protein